jgi:ATP-dependent DNA helicase RecG
MTEKGMPSLLVRLLDRLLEKESLDLEFKAAGGGLPRSLWDTVSAFANTQGGWIVLGVDENADPPTVGVSDPGRLVQQIHDLLRNPQKINHPVCGPNDVEIQMLDTVSIVVVRVPAAPRRSRPVYINNNPYQGTFVRRHGGDYLCSKQEVDRMMREAVDAGVDSTILPRHGLDDLDRDALRRYRRRFQTHDPGSPWNGYDDQRFVHAIGGYRRDRESGTEGLTVAGLLLLGQDVAIREWRTRHLIDYRYVEHDDGSNRRWDDRVTWEGCLFEAFERIYPKLVDGLPRPFQLSHGVRIDESPRHEALREGLVNLLVHADYAETDVSLITRGTEGYFFRNPGDSRVLANDLLTGDRSDPRSPTLVRMFRIVGLADEAGTGLPKILRAWRSLGFQAPEIEVGTERYEFSLHLRHAHLLSEDDLAWLRSLGENWSEGEQLALVVARHGGEVDNPTVRRLTGQHPADITRLLGNLRDRGLLQMIGVKRGARYQLGAVALPGGGALSSQLELDLVRSRDSSSNLRSDVAEPENSLTAAENPSPSLGNLPPRFGSSSESSEHSATEQRAELEGMDALTAMLQEIARPAQERRYLPSDSRDDLIVKLCAVRPLSVRELAHLLARSDDLVRKAVRPLLVSGQLRYRYPERPNHPAQQYAAAFTSTHQSDEETPS